jgi:hypothetical protein
MFSQKNLNTIAKTVNGYSTLILSKTITHTNNRHEVTGSSELELRRDNAGLFIALYTFQRDGISNEFILIEAKIFFPLSDYETESIIKTFEARNAVK